MCKIINFQPTFTITHFRVTGVTVTGVTVTGVTVTGVLSLQKGLIS
jgi:hypothetical protein